MYRIDIERDLEVLASSGSVSSLRVLARWEHQDCRPQRAWWRSSRGLRIVSQEIATPDRSARRSYLSFWNEVGTSFPSLKGAPTTDYYQECEQSLLATLAPPLAGVRIFKTDLWDEAKNTEILRWAAEQGARPYGADISLEVVAEARRVLDSHRPGFVVADVRALPFRDGEFDLVYSMGTIEHFPETELAVREIHRVLRQAGSAIVGVPNKLDPFLRPLLVAVLQWLGLYGYGVEKSYTWRQLRALLEGAGFEIEGRSGILFIPGWLRMADLWCHVRARPLTRITGLLTRPFAVLYRRFAGLRRHGYLIAGSGLKVGPRR